MCFWLCVYIFCQPCSFRIVCFWLILGVRALQILFYITFTLYSVPTYVPSWRSSTMPVQPTPSAAPCSVPPLPTMSRCSARRRWTTSYRSTSGQGQFAGSQLQNVMHSVMHSAIERVLYKTSYDHCDSESVKDICGLLCNVDGCSGVGG